MYRRRKSGNALSVLIVSQQKSLVFRERHLRAVRSLNVFEFTILLQLTAFVVRLAMQLGQRLPHIAIMEWVGGIMCQNDIGLSAWFSYLEVNALMIWIKMV